MNPSQKEIIKRYEKVTPGELAHIDITKVPKDIRTVFKVKDFYVIVRGFISSQIIEEITEIELDEIKGVEDLKRYEILENDTLNFLLV